jgi:hypothetical protein
VIEQVAARNYDQIQRNRCQFETQVSLVEVMIAAKAYSDSEGALPERLDDLVPRYLDALRSTATTARRCAMRAVRARVYSIGEDFTDGAAARTRAVRHARAGAVAGVLDRRLT